MEILAAIACLESLTEPCDIEIHSDSRYVVNAIEQGCAALWRSNGWKRNKEEHALNPDLWERLLNLLPKHNVRLTWLRGHADHEENERADELAVAALRSPHLEIDTTCERGG